MSKLQQLVLFFILGGFMTPVFGEVLICGPKSSITEYETGITVEAGDITKILPDQVDYVAVFPKKIDGFEFNSLVIHISIDGSILLRLAPDVGGLGSDSPELRAGFDATNISGYTLKITVHYGNSCNGATITKAWQT